MKMNFKYFGTLSEADLHHISLKKVLLFFDVVAVPKIEKLVSKDSEYKQNKTRDLEYLLENNLLIDPVVKYMGQHTYEQFSAYDKEPTVSIEDRKKTVEVHFKGFSVEDEWVKSIQTRISKDPSFGHKLINWVLQLLDYDRRGIARDLRNKFGINAFPVYPSITTFNNEFLDGKNDVIQVILNALPEPDIETVSWEQIMDFKNDPNTSNKLFSLRHWINNFARKTRTYVECHEELEYLCNEYRKHIHLHKMKAANGVLESFLLTSAEIVEGLIRVKPTKIVETLFSLRKHKVKLIEDELNAKGRDLAYIVQVKQTFQEQRK